MWLIGSSVLSTVILAAGWFIGVAPMLAMAADSTASLAGVAALNEQHERTLADLESRYADLDEVQDQLGDLRHSLPADADIADFLGTLDAIRESSGTIITNVTVSDGMPFVPAIPEPSAEVPAPVTDPATGTVEADAAAAAPAPVAAVTPASETPVSASTIVNAELVTADNFVAIPVSMTVDGSLEQVMAFVAGLQESERLYLVTGLSVTEDPTTGLFSGDIKGFVYALLDPTIGAPAAPDGSENAATVTAH